MQTIFETVPQGTIQSIISELKEMKELLSKGNKVEESELIIKKEACEMLGVSDVTIWSWAKQGKIKTYKIGNRIYLFRDEIKDLIKSNITKK